MPYQPSSGSGLLHLKCNPVSSVVFRMTFRSSYMTGYCSAVYVSHSFLTHPFVVGETDYSCNLAVMCSMWVMFVSDQEIGVLQK